MPFATFKRFFRAPEPRQTTLRVGEREVALIFVRNLRARRYILRMRPDRAARVTVPRGGSIDAAFEFARRQTDWIEKQLLKPLPSSVEIEWGHGTEILFRGETVPLFIETTSAAIRFADQMVKAGAASIRVRVERHLMRLAAKELPLRALELAQCYDVTVNRVTVRNQRSRWGSCSARGTISLNWRLIQTPPSVRDYIILHELMHRREMNHSERFWAHVELVCPEWREAEHWLRRNGKLLRG